MSPPTPIFWPADLRNAEGYCYGRKSPAYCVATISANRVQTPPTVSGAKFLGKCYFDAFGCVQLDFAGIDSEFTLIYYYRHMPSSLRSYSLQLHGDSRRAPRNPLVIHDFTRSSFHLNSDLFDSTISCESILPESHSLNVSKHILVAMGIALYLPRHVLSHSPFSSQYPILGQLARISSTARQLEARRSQVTSLTQQLDSLSTPSTSTHNYSTRYTSFFNTLWLILNDIIVGVAFGSFLRDNSTTLAKMTNTLIEVFFIDWIRWALLWLDSWPAGLKLNTELSHLYSHTFHDLVRTWGIGLHAIASHLSVLLYWAGILGCVCGMTIAIALMADLFGLLTFHITVCYYISRALYARFLHTGASLWNLFRGKRFNTLRNRTDNWEYDTDQLLFGTILFTLLAFLAPTVLAYYTMFALLRLISILVNAALETQLAFMNHFPLFALMLRVKDPWRIPYDIHLAKGSEPTISFLVKNKPVPLARIFSQYTQLWHKLAAHYNPLRLLKLVLSGKMLKPI
ncbi:N-acetylglucosaminyl transferase component gpi1 [Mycena indigotica]|uniref:N-acetylglucosaminyl transferase component gpi1 n=1 Tax=Mycena indigotica TaxID=2126181 RepID=A0A8H6S1C4_9AGAR|nr:N-acetylglucosaminyl transferase component gpi1 [Mycena indigotica]KAF7290513.1 N-acetylglucosaminyl transferase component gpi1 [Mycena indigotica]